MLGFGHFPELVFVLILALVFFGPKHLPELGSSLGRGIREFRKATNELHGDSIDNVAMSSPSESHHYLNMANGQPSPTQSDAKGVAAPPVGRQTALPANGET